MDTAPTRETLGSGLKALMAHLQTLSYPARHRAKDIGDMARTDSSPAPPVPAPYSLQKQGSPGPPLRLNLEQSHPGPPSVS